MSRFNISSTIVITTKHKMISLRLPLLVLISITGCICTLSVCISMVHPEYNRAVFWFITVLTALAACILSMLPNRMHFTGYIPLAAGIFLTLLKRQQVILGAKLFYNYYYFAVHNTDTQFFELGMVIHAETYVTWFLCCCSIILCSLISRVLIRKTYFIVYFALTFIPIEFGLYEGLNMDLPAMLILVATWVGVLALQLASHRGKDPMSHSVSSGNTANCGIAALAVTAAAVIVSVLICNQFKLTTDSGIQNKRHEIRDELESFDWDDFVNSVSNLGISLGIFEDPDLRKLGTKSTLEYREENEVQITLSEIPENSIYLKNYTGSIYENNSWSTFPKSEWDKHEELETLFTKFECVPQILPFMSNQSIYSSVGNATIEIEPLRKSALVLEPYAAYGQDCSYISDTECSVKDTNKYSYTISLMQNFYSVASLPLNNYYLPSSGFNFKDATTATFFEQLSIDPELDTFCISAIQPPYLDNSEYTTQALQASLTESYVYRSFVHENYTAVPSTDPLIEVFASLPAELLEVADSNDNAEKLRAIRSYLAEQCEYTTSPGETPSTRDFVNYFLLENNKGYCMHYATAGTLLARYLGIPARYCEGYIVSADMMANGDRNQDGSVTINIPDSASHAWCEYYIDGYGWVPYELTPGYYDMTSESEPQDSTAAEESSTEAETQTETEAETFEQTTTSVTTAFESQEDSVTTALSEKSDGTVSVNGTNPYLKVMLYVFITAAVSALILGMIVLLRNFRLNRRNREFNNPDTILGIICIYKFLMQLLKHLSLTPDNRQLLDFAEYVNDDLEEKGYDGNGAMQIIKLTLAADMGGKAPSREDIRTSIRYVNSLAAKIGKNKSPAQRLIMKYVFHLF